MRPTQPSKYEHVTPEQFDRFKQIAKTNGLMITNDKTETMYDGVSFRSTYDRDKQELLIEAHEPFWMAPGQVSGHIHELVSKALYRPEEFPKAPLAGDGKEKDPLVARDKSQPSQERTPLATDKEKLDATSGRDGKDGNGSKQVESKSVIDKQV